ncbi:hypothetical protein EZJ49_07740 [Bdellovibrio bacteriovorus]|uniref:hypothetical protein n=1 Tax=Bdellovibrio bacteriovorus TaxID=959 RepID=UPI0021CED529|nr:hypothetical protein [Bdellovibrio bacteriovorus]UXR66140.1 hypothetical protein EZJ49_07740 [Bdellovibrio bacteriovorus]
MKKLLVVLAVVLGFGSVSHADVLVEPYLGYEFGKTTDPDGKLTGSQLGLRLAYKTPLMLWVGADYTMGVSGEVDPDSTPKEDAKRTTLSGVVGIDFPILLRAWLGVGFTNDLKLDSGKLTGKNMKLGVGFTGLPFVSLNLEYIKDTWDEFDGNSLTTDAQNESYVLSVSLPLEF